MHAQVVRAEAQPGHLDAAVAVFRDDVVPFARLEHGYIRAYFFIDRAANRAMSLSLWEAEADVVALAASGFYREKVAKVMPHLSGAPEREVYEVAFQD